MTVYDLEGKPHDKLPIDARECVSECGWTIEPPEQPEQPEQPAVEAPAKKGRK